MSPRTAGARAAILDPGPAPIDRAADLSHERPEIRSAAARGLAAVVSEHHDDDALAALRDQLSRQPLAGARTDLRHLIAEVYGDAAANGEPDIE